MPGTSRLPALFLLAIAVAAGLTVGCQESPFARVTVDFGEGEIVSGRRVFGKVLKTHTDLDRDGKTDCVAQWSWEAPAASDTAFQYQDCDIDGDGYSESRITLPEGAPWLAAPVPTFNVDIDGDGSREWKFEAETWDAGRATVVRRLG